MVETNPLRKWLITLTVITASVIELIDTSIVNVALPDMMGNLGATLEDAAWVVVAYVVANVIVLPMTGWLSSLFGRRRYFIGSIVLFTVASMLCGQATNIWELVLFRFVQGAGGGGLLSTSQAILVETFPPKQLGLATALFGLGVVIGPTIGPTIGGVITDNFSWPWIFYVNLPIGIGAATLALIYIRDSAHARKRAAVDAWGIALLAVGVGCLQVVLERGDHEDWFSTPYIAVLTAISAVVLPAFVWHELRAPNPVVDLKVLKDRSLALGTVFTFILGFGLYSSVFIFPVFAQSILGFTATQTGLILLPGGLATAFMMPIVGKLLQRGFPPQVLNAAGFVLFFVFCLMLSSSTLGSSREDFFWPLVIRGVGLSFLFVPLTTVALSNLKGPDIAQGTGLTNMMRQLGGSFGIAIVATYIDRQSWANRTSLLRNLSPFDPAAVSWLKQVTAGFVSRGVVPLEAQRKALGALEGTLSRQVALLTFMDAFRLVGLFFVLCIPLLLLFRRGKGGAAAAPMH